MKKKTIEKILDKVAETNKGIIYFITLSLLSIKKNNTGYNKIVRNKKKKKLFNNNLCVLFI